MQRQLIKKIKDAGKKVVYVNCSGSAVALTPEDEICDAVLQAWYPGQAGGRAVAEVLFGDYNPGGRLPITFYKDDSQLPDFEDYSMVGRTYRYFKGEPLYPFGHGLSYTTFKYGKPKYSSTRVKAGEPVKVTVPVKNTGKMDGDEVVMVYVKFVRPMCRVPSEISRVSSVCISPRARPRRWRSHSEVMLLRCLTPIVRGW